MQHAAAEAGAVVLQQEAADSIVEMAPPRPVQRLPSDALVAAIEPGAGRTSAALPLGMFPDPPPMLATAGPQSHEPSSALSAVRREPSVVINAAGASSHAAAQLGSAVLAADAARTQVSQPLRTESMHEALCKTVFDAVRVHVLDLYVSWCRTRFCFCLWGPNATKS